MIAELLGRVAAVLLLRPEVSAAEVLLVAGVALLLLAVAGVGAIGISPAPTPRTVDAFDRVRVLLRASDPGAPGHRMARAPGAVR